MKEFFLEIYSEEVPPRLQNSCNIEQKMADIFIAKLAEIGILISSNEIEIYASPLRFVIKCNLPQDIILKSEEIRGPKISAPKAAIDGFLSKYSIKPENLTQNGDYFYFKSLEKNIQMQSEIPNIIKKFLQDASKIWPQTMRWCGTFEWIRPIRNICCLFDGKKIAIDIDKIPSTNEITGHKFASKIEKKEVNSASDYFEFIKSQGIILDKHLPQQDFARKNVILSNEIVKNVDSQNVVSEIAGLCEIPHILSAKIDEKFMILPHKVITTVMISHQRYIPIVKNGDLQRDFVIVVDKKITSNAQENSIIMGNSKVLNARLEDALFFYNKDLKTDKKELENGLKSVIFHPKVGSLFERLKRIKWVFEKLDENHKNIDAESIILHSKLDLCTQMVGEFPELQGYMALCYFSKIDNFKILKEIAENQYKNPDAIGEIDRLSAQFLLAEWIEYCLSLLCAGEVPTSSRDPLGIRRRLKNIKVFAQKYNFSEDVASTLAGNFGSEFFPKNTCDVKKIIDQI
ncbi:glycine--tRNA ligase subunit beta [Candidatus Deianiraea vastatrix]|uniref:glycine--tRNA ligase n=1 Tax=Candidatus Deianiraea vastatrix TaxID=2163644 RepID=A0A5B8XHC9_9RICK|nr:glycine--tRNA ligase subunit beta [Candidatus Deianiraea vastatrix]QED23511.1 Glycine--tRNA ligase beta subunit [Candidatus Deianiraea vastatrix]